MKIEYTERGFQIINFQDYYSKKCSLQQNSLALYKKPGTSAIWLGTTKSDRMHLNRKQVKELIKHLNKWLETGEF